MTDNSHYRLPSPMEAFFEKRKLEAVMRIQCLCGESFEGVARTVIELAAAHRKAVHPEWVDRGQGARRRAAGIVGSADAAA